jgi:predicted alpha-1,6-mannanase (GH76 family)
VTERDAQQTPRLWAARAGVAERAIYARHLRRLWALPDTRLGVSQWPASSGARLFGHWNYWWQAHLLDCLVDAQLRAPSAARLADLAKLTRGIHWRNGDSWVNDYYDDIAWLGVALLRAQRCVGLRRPVAVRQIAARLRSGWTDHAGGGIWWRRHERYHDDFKNVPANGPAAILLARLSDGADDDGCFDRADRQRARSTVEWIEQHLLDRHTGLVYDGLHVSPDGEIRQVETAIYTYCQGVFIGACVELARMDEPAMPTWAIRAVRTVDAVAEHVTVPHESGPVLRGQGGGDGGLFAGILARYLALAATVLPSVGPAFADAGQMAANLVFSSADAAWRNRTIATGGPLFGPEWAKPAVLPGRGDRPERDMSVQLGAWMLLEAAAALEAAGIESVGWD